MAKCASFDPTDEEHIRLWAKTPTGWQFTTTHPVRLSDTIDLNRYIHDCIQSCVSQAGGSWLLNLVEKLDNTNEMLHLVLSLWSATVLLMKGWQTKDWPVIATPSDPYVNTSPAPRVLQNQLDSLLEQYIVSKEEAFLVLLQKTLERRRSGENKMAFVTALIFLKIIERDTWRLMYWVRHKDQVGSFLPSKIGPAKDCRRINGDIQTLLEHSSNETFSAPTV